jgi:hypothetical protein
VFATKRLCCTEDNLRLRWTQLSQQRSADFKVQILPGFNRYSKALDPSLEREQAAFLFTSD